MIKSSVLIGIMMLAAILPSLAQNTTKQKVDVAFFTSPFCGFCQRCSREFLPQFKEKYKDSINFVEYNIFEEGNNAVFYDAVREYGLESSGVPAMIVGDSFFVGYPQNIKEQAGLAVEKAIIKGEKTRVRMKAKSTAALNAQAQSVAPQQQKQTQNNEDPGTVNTQEASPDEEEDTSVAIDEALAAPSDTKSIFEKMTLWAILGAGLIDGINPCAFAVIVFFISFLAVYKYEKKEIIVVGVCYCLSVFIAYILMGLGLFNFLYAMGSFYYVIMIFKWLTIALCAVFLVLSIYDLVIYKMTGNSEKILLQLPKSYKEYIHKVMRFFLRDKNKSMFRLILASVAVGFVVSLVEAVCTGQVYLPTIVLILKEADTHFWRAVSYLLLYNFMFIIPLIVIFILTLLGYESKGFNDFLKKHLALTKFLLSLVFLILLVLLLVSM